LTRQRQSTQNTATMPGLLHAEEGTTTRLYAAIAAEFVCSFLFAFIGAAAPGSSAAAANGIALAVLVYVSANVSGGHLNPAGELQAAAGSDI
jgi:glycerol uptake facilitator-like aquaporin